MNDERVSEYLWNFWQLQRERALFETQEYSTCFTSSALDLGIFLKTKFYEEY